MNSNYDRLFQMPWQKLYPNYVNKVVRKDKNPLDIELIIHWLFGYDQKALHDTLNSDMTVLDFLIHAPKMHKDFYAVKGKICGVDIEKITDIQIRKIRVLDKLIDELAKGKKLEQILSR